MTFKIAFGVLLGICCAAQGTWILVARPEPPPSARTATRTSRKAIALTAVALGTAYTIFQISELF